MVAQRRRTGVESMPAAKAHDEYVRDPVLESEVIDIPAASRGRWQVDPYVKELLELRKSGKAKKYRLTPTLLEKFRMAMRHAIGRDSEWELGSRRISDEWIALWAKKTTKIDALRTKAQETK